MSKLYSFPATRQRWILRCLLLLAAVLPAACLRAQLYVPVTLSGLTEDVIANGPTLAGSVTADGDGTGFYFLNSTFTQHGSPTYFLPASGTLNSLATPGLTYQLASASGPNSLRLSATTTSGSLTFGTPRAAATLYLLTTSGSGASTITVTVIFQDASTQVFSGQSIGDWYTGTTGIAVQGVGRTSATALEGNTTQPRFFQLALAINPANYSKPIVSVAVNRTAGGITHVMAATVSTPCTQPMAQPTALTFGAAQSTQISGSFTAATPASDQYLVVRYAGGATPTAPADGVTYTAGASLGAGNVVQVSPATGFNATGVQPTTAYDFYVYAMNSTNCVGPVYNTVNPLMGSSTTVACGGPSGTIAVGPTGSYPTLTAALAALSGGISGPVVMELQPAYASAGETFPIVISGSGCFTAINNITIRPAAGAPALSISSSNAGPTVDIAGAGNVKIDGRPGGTGTAIGLSVINTSASGAAVRIAGDAASDTLTYLDLQGQNTSNTSSALSGVVYIGTTGTTGNGNDNLVISHCNIHGTAGGTPAIGISAYGSNNTVAAYNDNILVDANNIYDFYLANSASTGLKADQGNNAWMISGNSFYQSVNRTYTTGATHRALWITPNVAAISNTASGFSITGNYIGGSAPQAAGNAYTMQGNITNIFNGMDISVGSGATTSILNNTITNIALNTTTTGNSFIGIGIANGNVAVGGGGGTGNIIGSANATGRISVTQVTTSGGTVWGVRIGSGNSVSVSQNAIGGFNIAGTGAISANFIGIGTGGGTTYNVSNNTIGGFPGSITLGASTAATAQSATGISIANGTSSVVDGNTVSDLTNNYTGSGTGTTRGIVVSTTASVISNNVVRNLTSTSPTASGGATSVLTGIAMTSGSGVDVIGNTVHSLSLASASTTAAANITGIFFSGSGTIQSKVQRNILHSFEFSAANTNITITGVDFATGATTLANNMIRLGVKADGTPLATAAVVRGISSNSSSTSNNFYHNTIHIGGSGVGTTAKNSYALIRTSSNGTYDIRNNILVNERSNATTGGKHYALYFTTATTGATPDYNVYRAAGTGGVFAFNGSADVSAYTPGWLASDAHSITTAPVFVDAAGPAASVNLHLVPAQNAGIDNKGIGIAAITFDIDGETRNASTPDPGADEFAGPATGVHPTTLVSPSVRDCFSSTETVSFRFRNDGALPIDFSVTPVTAKAEVAGATTTSLTQTISTGTLAAGDSLLVTFAQTVDLSAPGIYTVKAIALIAGDADALNDTLIATRISVPVTAASISAASAAVCISGTPTLTLGGNSGGSVQWQESSSATGPWTNVGSGNATYTPASPITTSTWYQAVVGCNGNSATTPVVSVSVSNPQVTATVPASRCGSGTVTLGATASAGTTLAWYAGAADVTPAGNGTSFTTPSISVNTTYYVEARAATPAGCVSPRTAVIATVNTATAIGTQPQSLSLCPGSSASFTVSASGTGLSYQWKKGGAGIPGANATTLSLTNINAADAAGYSVEVTGTCGSVTSSVATLAVFAANSWNGTVSDDWNNSANWCGAVPTPGSDVTIPVGTPFSPVISGVAEVRQLTIGAGATVTMGTGAQFSIYGDLVNNGTFNASAGTLIFRGSAAQNVPALNAANVVINGAGVVLTGVWSLNALTLQSGQVTLGSNDLTIGSVTGGSAGSHIITNGSGRVSSAVSTGPVVFPVGPDAASFDPVTLSDGQGIVYRVSVATGITPALADNSKAVNRTWSVLPATAPASPVNVTLQYDNAHANTGFVAAGPLEAGNHNGTQWRVISPSGGLTPTGAAAARQVTLPLNQFGALVVTSPGAIDYLTAVPALNADIAAALLLPNPVLRQGTLRLSIQRPMTVQVRLRDGGGRLLRSFTRRLAAGVNTISIDGAGLSQGLHYIEVGEQGKKPFTLAFIKGS